MEIKLKRRYIIKTQNGSILCQDGEFFNGRFVGPGAHGARAWKRKSAAEAYALRINGTVHEIDERGIEV